MTIVCVDGEAPVLDETVSLCRALPQKPAAEGFLRAKDALDRLKTQAADIVILETRLPDMDGVALATKIRELQPDIAVIFLTGSADRAVEAFALHASGYLIKPASPERLAAEIAFAMNGRQPIKQAARAAVRTFGEFDVLLDGSPILFERARAKELLAFLIDRQGGFVTRANVFAVLWENRLYDRSMQKQLDVVIRSLRATLTRYGIGDIIEMRKGSLRAVPEKLDCDLYRFLGGDASAADAYRGEYMNAYSWASLTEAYMDRLRQ